MKFKPFLKRCMTPVTIMIVPHARSNLFKIRVSLVGLIACLALSFVGAAYVISIGVKTLDYHAMKSKLSYFTREFYEIRSTAASLKETDRELSKLLSLKSKGNILKSAELKDTGSLDIELLKKQVNEAIESVSAIKLFIAEQRDVYLSTPTGWPVQGTVSSGFGPREHPVSHEVARHTGVDIRTPAGSVVKATAAGIVSFSGWTSGSGYIVVLEHGHGFSTAYAHNRENIVSIGQEVSKGEKIALSGSSGVSTGPHLHYEIWKDEKQVDPISYLKDV
jgi:murein DD-endopeptidase MepM/ murein hydrolase activator NlpD